MVGLPPMAGPPPLPEGGSPSLLPGPGGLPHLPGGGAPPGLARFEGTPAARGGDQSLAATAHTLGASYSGRYSYGHGEWRNGRWGRYGAGVYVNRNDDDKGCYYVYSAARHRRVVVCD